MFPNSQRLDHEFSHNLMSDYALYESQTTSSQKWQQMASINPICSQDLCHYDSLSLGSQIDADRLFSLYAQQENQENMGNQQEQKPVAGGSLGTQVSRACSDYARQPGVSSQPALLPRHFSAHPSQVFIVNTGGGSCPILLTDFLRVVNSEGHSVMVPSVSFLKQAKQTVHREPQQQVLRNSAARIQKTPEQLRVLESYFSNCDYPCSKTRKQIAEETGLTDNQVRLWFQYKRNKRNRATQED